MRSIFLVFAGFLLGCLFQTFNLYLDRSDPFGHALAFLLGMVVCFAGVYLYTQMLIKGVPMAKKVEEEKDDPYWWKRGDRPPWET
jgi:hypothetical protein